MRYVIDPSMYTTRGEIGPIIVGVDVDEFVVAGCHANVDVFREVITDAKPNEGPWLDHITIVDACGVWPEQRRTGCSPPEVRIAPSRIVMGSQHSTDPVRRRQIQTYCMGMGRNATTRLLIQRSSC